jgi:hypothetical protein
MGQDSTKLDRLLARLYVIEVFSSKIARSFLRYIRVKSKEELVGRMYQGIDEINQEPVVFRWRYKMDVIAAV